MNRINPAKLLLSKWTAARPRNKEKHFLVTELFRDEDGTVLEIENDDGQKVIINQQAAMQEVWLASRAGGYHFKFDNDAWVNTRDGRDFWDYLAEALTGLA